jgi:hypothetical protein
MPTLSRSTAPSQDVKTSDRNPSDSGTIRERILALCRGQIETNRRLDKVTTALARLAQLVQETSLRRSNRLPLSPSLTIIRDPVRAPAGLASSSRPSLPLVRNPTEPPPILYSYDSDSSSDSPFSPDRTLSEPPPTDSPTEHDLYPVCESCLESLLENVEDIGDPEPFLDGSGSEDIEDAEEEVEDGEYSEEVEYSEEEEAYDSESSRQEYGSGEEEY